MMTKMHRRKQQQKKVKDERTGFRIKLATQGFVHIAKLWSDSQCNINLLNYPTSYKKRNCVAENCNLIKTKIIRLYI